MRARERRTETNGRARGRGQEPPGSRSDYSGGPPQGRASDTDRNARARTSVTEVDSAGTRPKEPVVS